MWPPGSRGRASGRGRPPATHEKHSASHADKAALLLALARTHAPGTAHALGRAMQGPDANEHGESLPRLAVRLLGERAAKDAEARDVLVQLAFTAAVPEPVRCRAMAFATAASDARGRELLALRAEGAGDEVLMRAVTAATVVPAPHEAGGDGTQ